MLAHTDSWAVWVRVTILDLTDYLGRKPIMFLLLMANVESAITYNLGLTKIQSG